MENIIEQINEAGVKFLEPLNPEETYEIIVQEAVHLIDAEYGSIILYQNGNLERVYSSSEEAYQTINRKNGNTYTSFKEKKVIIADIDEIGGYHPELIKLGIKTSIFIPLSYQNKAIGVLTVNSKSKLTSSTKELKILQLFGAMASLAIRKVQLYTETKNALEVRDMFIALASHELRTPLTSMNGYIQLLHSKLSKDDSSEGRWIRELYDESGRLTNLVKELLEINRIKQGQLNYVLRSCHFHEVVEKAVERVKFINPERKIVYTNEIEDAKDEIIADPEKIMQMVGGLLNNAIRYSAVNTEITVTLRASEELLHLKIEDEGEGIHQDDLPHIFEEFYKRVKNSEKQGMGIGLLLAKHIITYHKGKIAINSELGKGTTVEVTLPQAEYD